MLKTNITEHNFPGMKVTTLEIDGWRVIRYSKAFQSPTTIPLTEWLARMTGDDDVLWNDLCCALNFVFRTHSTIHLLDLGMPEVGGDLRTGGAFFVFKPHFCIDEDRDFGCILVQRMRTAEDSESPF